MTAASLGLVRLGPRLSGANPHQRPPPQSGETKQFGVRVSKFHHGLRSLIAACALLAAAPAQATPVENQLIDLTSKVTTQVTDLAREAVSFLGFGGDQANNPTDPSPVAEGRFPEAREVAARSIEPAAPVTAVAAVTAPEVPALVRETPRVDRSLKKVFCVEYARMRSGLAVFGDAKQWWERARNLYARASHPVEEAVMVFSGSKRLKRGHVAVVTDIVGPREIIVDHANWQNKREVDLATPVLDVSANNDWSQVRVWDIPSGQFGSRTYAISGFITKGLIRQARND